MRCWGGNAWGQLGRGDTRDVGDEPGALPVASLALAGPAEQIGAGHGHVCAILGGGQLRCWGWNLLGQLGNGSTEALGDEADELPPPTVALAGVVEVVAGVSHTCARVEAGTVHCWGSSSRGELGYGDALRRGDAPGDLPTPAVALGGAAVQLAAGGHHTCALLADASLRCWGANDAGQLGQARTGDVGDEPGEMPPPPIAVDGVVQVVAGANHTCTRHEDGAVRCWGAGAAGQLGDGKTADVGVDPLTFPPAPVDLGGEADLLAASGGDDVRAPHRRVAALLGRQRVGTARPRVRARRAVDGDAGGRGARAVLRGFEASHRGGGRCGGGRGQRASVSRMKSIDDLPCARACAPARTARRYEILGLRPPGRRYEPLRDAAADGGTHAPVRSLSGAPRSCSVDEARREIDPRRTAGQIRGNHHETLSERVESRSRKTVETIFVFSNDADAAAVAAYVAAAFVVVAAYGVRRVARAPRIHGGQSIASHPRRE
ncbi:hypothetical protein OV079_03220 [Nannocystis pusilla]|uniref:Uncharacterized protein n=1 Tax=Nannocystis pusilla TaxID=889268 RepID=A0A9X3EPY1_9BACT|nr:hypothetical protein [Nannocystis pusilla]